MAAAKIMVHSQEDLPALHAILRVGLWTLRILEMMPSYTLSFLPSGIVLPRREETRQPDEADIGLRIVPTAAARGQKGVVPLPPSLVALLSDRTKEPRPAQDISEMQRIMDSGQWSEPMTSGQINAS